MLTNPHVETTAAIWPNNQQLKDKLSFPLALALQPFGNVHPEGKATAQKISQYRCQSCKAFLNQLCFIRSDHQYDCSLCGCTNYMREAIDISMPELNNLSYRVRAPKEQRLLSSKERLVVFVLDLSLYGVESKEYLLYSIQVIRQFVKSVCENELPFKIMLVGFDSGIHRYVINPPRGSQFSRIISSGSEEAGDDEYFSDKNEQIGDVKQCRQNIEDLLKLIQEEVIADQLRDGKSIGIVDAIQYSLRASQGYSGKIILVTGLRDQPHQFRQKMMTLFFDPSHQHNFISNKKCLEGDFQQMLQSTQMSLSLFFINASFINNLPFHCMTKHTNGEMRHFFPNQTLLFFHAYRDLVQSLLQQDTVFQSLMRVRYSTGLKLVGIFGAFRPTKIVDQIELLSCPGNRRYLFQFIVQGKITSEFVIVQFSSLYTNLKGDRYFIIETQVNKVSDDTRSILSSIDYTNISISYVRGVIHNLDSVKNTRNLQLILQERCKKHIKAIRQLSLAQNLEVQRSEKSIDILSKYFKKVKPYIIITFLLMKHFLVNQQYTNKFHYDLNAQVRSKVATFEDSLNIIWPLIYAVKEDGWEIIEMRGKYISKATVAIFIDRCDQYYVYLINPKFQAHLRTANAKQLLRNLIDKQQSLQSLKRLIEELKETKDIAYIDYMSLEDISELRILDLEGQFGFDKFIAQLIKDS